LLHATEKTLTQSRKGAKPQRILLVVLELPSCTGRLIRK